jgi:hypothetical protein
VRADVCNKKMLKCFRVVRNCNERLGVSEGDVVTIKNILSFVEGEEMVLKVVLNMKER